jgi:hypothetical protein
MPFGRAGNQGRVVGVDDRIEQARGAAVEVFLAELRGALEISTTCPAGITRTRSSGLDAAFMSF